MPRPRARLDHAAIAVAFATDGLHGVSAAQVAARAGVAKPTLYAHGRSKEQVFVACVEAEVERLLDRLYAAEQGTRDLTAGRRAGALVLAILEHADRWPHSARLLHLTARHATSTVAGEVDAALARIPARVRRALGCEAALAVALCGAAGALALAGVADRHAAAELVGEAFRRDAALPPDLGDRPVATVSIY
ncbi:MAG TPA: helix-turn-helix domain-containing protein [Solirubrobacteraceae bacterium]